MNDKPESRKELSTTALAKALKKNAQDVFEQLAHVGLIVRTDNTWQLTATGKLKGGLYREHEKYGTYIVWPESIVVELDSTGEDVGQKLLTATAIGKIFEVPVTRINLILSELGWITKYIKGWQITELGKRLGGIQSEDKVSGTPYVRWHGSIVNNRILVNSIRESRGEVSTHVEDKPQNIAPNDLQFREKFEAKLRAKDGHYVRSKAEIIIDNWLYDSKITHAYERKLPIEEEQYCDFFINNGNGKGVYIEYWGYESDSKYLSRKERKIETYKKYGLQLIELSDKEVSSLDDVLPKKLLKFGIPIE
ncbi:MAG: glycerol kinase [Chloroflexi bacterium]|nr:glycerol kinase [Chloroflexota bacterium]